MFDHLRLDDFFCLNAFIIFINEEKKKQQNNHARISVFFVGLSVLQRSFLCEPRKKISLLPKIV